MIRTPRKLLLLSVAALCMASCSVQATYIGKSYPATDAPELFFSWNDVPYPYETMGEISASPRLFKPLEDAQATIERKAREKGADAVVFENFGRDIPRPVYTTTEKIEPNEDGSKTRKATTTQSVTTSNHLTAVFIKYKK